MRQDGSIGGRLDLVPLTLPSIVEIEATDQRLIWGQSLQPLGATPGRGLLEDFVALAILPDEKFGQAVRGFALRWGVLEICEHRLPRTHNGGALVRGPHEQPACVALGIGDKAFRREMEARYPVHGWHLWGYEPLGVWRRLAATARAMLNIAASLQNQRPGTAKDWAALGIRAGGLFLGPNPEQVARDLMPWLFDIKSGRAQLSRVVTGWLELGGVRPVLEWGDGPRMRLSSNNMLMGAIAMQLLLAAAGSDGFAICSGCKRDYVPKRQPRLDQNAWCDECVQRGIPVREAVRRLRARKRASETIGTSSAEGSKGSRGHR